MKPAEKTVDMAMTHEEITNLINAVSMPLAVGKELGIPNPKLEALHARLEAALKLFFQD